MFNITDKQKLIDTIVNKVNTNTYLPAEDVYSADIKENVRSIATHRAAYYIRYTFLPELVKAIVDELYTHDEFERDLGLKE